MPLYLSDTDVDADRYSAHSLHESREELDDVTPGDGGLTEEMPLATAAPSPAPGIPADRDADFARDAEISRRESIGSIGGLALAGIATGGSETETGIVHAQHASGAGPGPEIMAAETLQGDRVLNLQGELLGKIRDIMIDVRRGRIAYAVMSSGGVMGFGDRLYALPWSALTLDAEQHCFTLDVSCERLARAPGFDRERWPSMADPAFAASVDEFYGRPSYWKELR